MDLKEVHKLEDLEGTPQTYKKKPICIRAILIHEKVCIHTKEGTLIGKDGDYIIEGVEGEIYPCDKSIFHKTYDECD